MADGEAVKLVEAFKLFLKKQKAEGQLKASIKALDDNPALHYRQLCHWLGAYLQSSEANTGYLPEAAMLMHTGSLPHRIVAAQLQAYQQQIVPDFEELQRLKKELVHGISGALRLEEFKPRVMSSFVRNKLLDEVYLPLTGANLAK